jgi:hypothetical protein
LQSVPFMIDIKFEHQPKIIWQTRILTLAGALPFLIALLLVIFPQAGFDGVYLATSYAALIISFLCGTLWTQALKASDRALSPLLIKSNLVTLIAWAALLFLPNLGTLVLHGLCFLYLLFLDQSLFLRGYLPPWYYSLRRMVTVLVFTLIVLLMGALTF